VIMEAMAAGLPVVSTQVAGIPEMIDAGVTGKLVPAGDGGAFAEAVAAYLADPELAQGHGAEGKRRCALKFDVRASARRLAELLVHQAGVRPPQPAIGAWPELKSRTPWWRKMLGV
jgi:glycosyltransferase involved in cell wall biosynthesis